MKVLASCLFIFVLSTVCFAQEAPPANQRPLAFTHVTVIDATGAPAKLDMTVIVSANRIMSIGKTGQVTLPANVHVIDATHKFMIPGLWEMHTHAFIRSRKSF